MLQSSGSPTGCSIKSVFVFGRSMAGAIHGLLGEGICIEPHSGVNKLSSKQNKYSTRDYTINYNIHHVLS